MMIGEIDEITQVSTIFYRLYVHSLFQVKTHNQFILIVTKFNQIYAHPSVWYMVQVLGTGYQEIGETDPS